jgi:tetratricopeptide (TPR) repeat protein
MAGLRGRDNFLLDIGAVLGLSLAELGSEVWDECSRWMRSGTDSETRPSAMRARTRHDTATLRAALKHPEEQMLAAVFLAQLYCYEASEEIAQLLDAEPVGVRSAAVQALGELDGWAYRDRLRAMAQHDPSVLVRRSCVLALAWIADGDDEERFERFLDSGWVFRGAAVAGLAALGQVGSLGRIRTWQRRDSRHPRYLLMRHFYRRAIRDLEARERTSAAARPSPPDDPGPLLARVLAGDEAVARIGEADDVQSKVELAWALIGKANALGELARLDEAYAVFDDVVARLDSVEEREVEHAVAGALQGKAYWLGRADRREEAVVLYEAIVERFGEAMEAELRTEVATARVNEGITLDQLERDDEALEEYDEVVSQFGDDEEPELRGQVARALLSKAFLLGEHQARPEQLATYDDLLERFGKSVEPDIREHVAVALAGKARELRAARHDEEALQAYDEIVASIGDPAEPEFAKYVSDALYWRGKLLTKLVGGRKATTAYDDLLSRFSQAGDPEIRRDVAYGLYAKARALAEFHRVDEAASAYHELITRYGVDTDPWVENLVDDARRARKHLDKWWWRLLHGL